MFHLKIIILSRFTLENTAFRISAQTHNQQLYQNNILQKKKNNTTNIIVNTLFQIDM